jgi:hypothetical protein
MDLFWLPFWFHWSKYQEILKVHVEDHFYHDTIDDVKWLLVNFKRVIQAKSILRYCYHISMFCFFLFYCLVIQNIYLKDNLYNETRHPHLQVQLLFDIIALLLSCLMTLISLKTTKSLIENYFDYFQTLQIVDVISLIPNCLLILNAFRNDQINKLACVNIFMFCFIWLSFHDFLFVWSFWISFWKNISLI